MKRYIVFIAILFINTLHSQKPKTDLNINKDKMLAEFSNIACKCIDSVETFNIPKDSTAAGIHTCIDKNVTAYQMGAKLSELGDFDLSDSTSVGKEINITINTNKDSPDYKKYYYQMERYLMENCASIKQKMAEGNKVTDKSISYDAKARAYYNQGLEETKKENYKGAIESYKKAVKIDPQFAFAYDNMGICYRRLNQYDKAIDAYEKSLAIDPEGTMPLQNIAVAYQYMKSYEKAVGAYEKLAKLNPDNPEVFFGIGQVYALYLNDEEKGLDNMCKAYNLYVKQKSPYRTDAEKIIQLIYDSLKEKGKESMFNEILEKNNITPNKAKQ